MKTIGIIGGLGPETTAEFYLRLIELSYLHDKHARPPILLWSVPLEYQVEEDFIVRAEGEARYLPYLIEAAKRLEQGGADFIVIPCNSVHIFLEEVRAGVSIPVLSIVEENTQFLLERGISRVGLLATAATRERNLYGSIFQKRGIQEVYVPLEQQRTLGEVINRLVRHEHTKEDKETLLEMLSWFVEQGITTILLACTDLQLLVDSAEGVEIFDTMEILARVTVQKVLEE